MSKRSNADLSANAGPETILPLMDFRGDPWETGDKNAVSFRAGIMSSPVPAEFAQKMRDEGKAAPKSVAPAIEPAPDAVNDQPAED